MRPSGNDYRARCVIAMPTETYALQGESLLAGAAIPARVVRLPAGATKKGCAYGLEVPCRRLDEAAGKLESRGVRRGEILYGYSGEK